MFCLIIIKYESTSTTATDKTAAPGAVAFRAVAVEGAVASVEGAVVFADETNQYPIIYYNYTQNIHI